MAVRQSTGSAAEPTWVTDVLQFWFAELGQADWFTARAELDARIRERFLSLHTRLAADDALTVGTQRSLLAAVIVLDQFSRNMFRRAPRMFAADARAREACQEGLLERDDAELAFDERVFFYLPLMHNS